LSNRLMNKGLLFDKMQKEAPDDSGALLTYKLFSY
jgi:hypothetical protein